MNNGGAARRVSCCSFSFVDEVSARRSRTQQGLLKLASAFRDMHVHTVGSTRLSSNTTPTIKEAILINESQGGEYRRTYRRGETIVNLFYDMHFMAANQENL